ncbi:MAG: methionine adenosyltransferase [Thermotogae bacterium]|nr:methionine adenosyltransferase [Thermotogota bacterium]
MVRIDLETAPFIGDFEIVERKGTGHPDTICDSIAEEYSRALSRFYLERYGRILHHNVDKAILVGGEANPRFGGGEVSQPIELTIVGRVTYRYKGDEFRKRIEEIYYETAKSWLKENLPNLDVEKHIDLNLKIRMGSEDLTDLFEREGEIPLANDTSFGVGFYPLTKAEKLTYELERFLNARAYKEKHPYVGEDIKVMVVRDIKSYRVTVALAFVDRYVNNLKHYRELKAHLQADTYVRAKELVGDVPLSVELNVADDYRRESVYITVTGTSAEAGDDGQVGRGNRVNGLITPYRPMTLEAAAGKNPVSHVGKLYNIAANFMAKEIVEKFPAVENVYIYLVSQIGRPINEPQLVHARIWGGLSESALHEVKEYLTERVRDIGGMWKRIVFDGVEVV